MPITKINLGDRFDDFLQEEGIYEECTEAAVKRIKGSTPVKALVVGEGSAPFTV